MRTTKGPTPPIVTISLTASQAEQLLYFARDRIQGWTKGDYASIGLGLPLAEAALKDCDEDDCRWLLEPDIVLYANLLNAGVNEPEDPDAAPESEDTAGYVCLRGSDAAHCLAEVEKRLQGAALSPSLVGEKLVAKVRRSIEPQEFAALEHDISLYRSLRVAGVAVQ